jgi:hypothetical protein
MRLIPSGTNGIVTVLFPIEVMIEVTYCISRYFSYWANDEIYLRPKTHYFLNLILNKFKKNGLIEKKLFDNLTTKQ